MHGGVRHSHAEIHMMASDNQEQTMNDKTVVNVILFLCVCACGQMLLFQMVGYVMFRVARLLVLRQILCLL